MILAPPRVEQMTGCANPVPEGQTVINVIKLLISLSVISEDQTVINIITNQSQWGDMPSPGAQ